MQNKEIAKTLKKLLDAYIESQHVLASLNEMIDEKYTPEKDPLVKESKQVLKKLGG